MVIERGWTVRVCVDDDCESTHEAVRAALDAVADCPTCGAPLRVRRHRGRSYLGCDAYPACETTFPVPRGVIVGDCDCGLPAFRTDAGRRCLDGDCDETG